jgi:hypothetical protein
VCGLPRRCGQVEDDGCATTINEMSARDGCL